MKTWIVTRHLGALDFLKSQGICGQHMPHLMIDAIQSGDKVIGNLPLHHIALLNKKNVEYWHLCVEQPLDMRGKEHSLEFLMASNATLRRFKVIEEP